MPEHSDFFDAAVRLHLFFRFAHAKSVNRFDPVIGQDLVQDDHEEGGSTEHCRIRSRVLFLYQGEDFGGSLDHFIPVGNLVKRQRISDDALVPGVRLNDTGSKLLWRGSVLGEVDNQDLPPDVRQEMQDSPRGVCSPLGVDEPARRQGEEEAGSEQADPSLAVLTAGGVITAAAPKLNEEFLLLVEILGDMIVDREPQLSTNAESETRFVRRYFI